MRVERPNPEYPGQTDLYTVCDNPDCGRQRHDGYTAPWMMFAGPLRLEWDGWHTVRDIHACSWACLAVVAASRATEVPV